MKVALIHDWLTGMRGGEFVLEAIAGLFREPELFTLIKAPGSVSPALERIPTHVSSLQKIPGGVSKYRHFLPIMPKMIEQFDLSGFDLIVSSSHCVAKGIHKPHGSVHVSYVHAPMRYMWDRFDDYFGPGRASPAVRAAARAARPFLQRWDRRSAAGIDQVVANSSYIAGRVKAAWGMDARVAHPFVNLGRFSDRPRRVGDFYLMVTAFAPYKRVDLAIEAFNELKLPLKIVGSGQDEEKLRAMAGPTVQMLGSVPHDQIAELYASCRALIFPGIEDFGITPLEAMASGAPVIAYGEGGALETVTSETGVFFKQQSVDALVAAAHEIESRGIAGFEAACRARAKEFSRERFETKFRAMIRDAWLSAGKPGKELDQAFIPA